VVSGADGARAELDADELKALVDDHIAKGSTRKDAIAAVTKQTGQPKRDVYDAAHR